MGKMMLANQNIVCVQPYLLNPELNAVMMQ
jgi:hypothetical protein